MHFWHGKPHRLIIPVSKFYLKFSNITKNAAQVNLICRCHRIQNLKISRYCRCYTHVEMEACFFLYMTAAFTSQSVLHVNQKMPALLWDNGHIWILNWRALQSTDWRLNIAWIEYNFADLLWQIIPSNFFSQTKSHLIFHPLVHFLSCELYLLFMRCLPAFPSESYS